MPCKLLSLSIEAPLGYLDGVRLADILTGKESTSGFLYCNHRTLRF
jgi:hypothetical protein